MSGVRVARNGHKLGRVGSSSTILRCAVAAGAIAVGWNAGLSSLAGIRTLVTHSSAPPRLSLWRSAAASSDYLNRRSLSLFPFSTTTSTTPMSFTLPQPAPTWTHTAEQILSQTKELIEKNRKLQDSIGALKPEECTFESVRRSFHI